MKQRGREMRIRGLFNRAVLQHARKAGAVINQPRRGSRLIADGC